MANIKYADPSYTDIPPTDDDKVMFRTAAGGDARGSIVQPKGYIDGLRMIWVSGTQIQVTRGAAYVPGAKRIVELATATTITPTLAANQWYHVYLKVASGSVSVEAVAVNPDAPYTGTARTKSGDTSTRYLGSIKTDPSSALWQFAQDDRYVKWFVFPGVGTASVFRVLSNGNAMVATTFSLSAVVPMTSMGAFARVFNTNASGSTYFDIPGRGGTFGIIPINAGQNTYCDVNTDASQQMAYMNAAGATSPGAYVDVNGYVLDR